MSWDLAGGALEVQKASLSRRYADIVGTGQSGKLILRVPVYCWRSGGPSSSGSRVDEDGYNDGPGTKL